MVASEILFSKLFTFVFNFVFLTTALSATSFHFVKYTGTVFSLPTSKSSIFVFKLFKLVGALVSLLLSNLSI